MSDFRNIIQSLQLQAARSTVRSLRCRTVSGDKRRLGYDVGIDYPVAFRYLP